MPAGYDAEVASLFRDLRVASNMTETDLAARIATPVEVVQALEQGAIYALPPWPETCRVVNAYGTLLNLDTRPLLRRIYAQLEAGVVELGPKPVSDVPVMVPPANLGPAPGAPSEPQAPAWPNGRGGLTQPDALQPNTAQPAMPQRQAAPQAPQQAPWPGGAPPGTQAAPAWPNGPQQAQPAAPQVAAPQVASPQAGPHAQPQTAPPQMAPPQAVPPQGAPSLQHSYAPDPPAPSVEDASFPETGYAEPQAPDGSFPLQDAQPQDAPPQDAQADAVFLGDQALEPEPEVKKKKPALLKWGIGALVAAVVLAGLWIALGDGPGDAGLMSGFNTSDPVLDPDDPRSRKADRLPDNF